MVLLTLIIISIIPFDYLDVISPASMAHPPLALGQCSAQCIEFSVDVAALQSILSTGPERCILAAPDDSSAQLRAAKAASTSKIWMAVLIFLELLTLAWLV